MGNEISIIEWAKVVLPIIVSWPVAAVLIAVIFRRFLQEFLSSLTKAKVGPLELEREIQKVKEDTKNLKNISQLVSENEKLRADLDRLIQDVEGANHDRASSDGSDLKGIGVGDELVDDFELSGDLADVNFGAEERTKFTLHPSAADADNSKIDITKQARVSKLLNLIEANADKIRYITSLFS